MQEVSGERAFLLEQRASFTVPPQHLLPSMNRLETERANARGALDVGLVAIVTPHRPLDLTVRRDGEGVDPRAIAKPEEIEANTDLEVDVPGIVNIRVRGGDGRRRRDSPLWRVAGNRRLRRTWRRPA